MRLLLLAGLAVAAPAPLPAPMPQMAEPARDMPVIVPGETGRTDCPETAASLARRDGGRLQPHRLGELPGADQYAAVYRRIDGCEAPLVVSYGIGGRSPAQELRQGR